MPPVNVKPSSANLAASGFLHRHEVASLQILATARLVMSAISFVGLKLTAGLEGQVIQGLAILPQVLVGIFTLVTIRRSRFPQRLGFIGTLADSLTLLLLPALFAYSTPPITAISLLKNDIEVFVLGFAIVNSFSLRPIQPVVIGAVSALSLVGYYFYASLYFGPLQTTTSWAETIGTPTIQMGSYWFNGLLLIPALCFLLGYLVLRGRNYILHAARLERDTAALERYFSPDVVTRIRLAPDLYAELGGQSRSIAVMFIDLRDFTHLSEQLPPEETVRMLSDYYQHLADAVFGAGGSIDKFLGDGLMATFGMLGQEDAAAIAQSAVRAGLGVRAALVKINETRLAQGQTSLRQGIGIHFGEAVVGNFGTAQRMEFTAVGDTVNIASRVQEMCKEFQVDFLVTEQLVTLLNKQDYSLQSRGEVLMRGKTKPIQVYQVEAVPGTRQTIVPEKAQEKL